MDESERIKRRAEARQKRNLAKLAPAVRIATEEVWQLREEAVQIITRCNSLDIVVHGLQRVLEETRSDNIIHTLTSQLLPLLKQRAEELEAAKEAAKKTVADKERHIQEQRLAEEVACFPQQHRERATQLIAEREAKCEKILDVAAAGAFGSAAGLVLNWQFKLDKAERDGDAIAADLARRALDVALPAKQAAEELVRKGRRQQKRIEAKYQRLLDELRG